MTTPDFLIWHCAGCGAAADGTKKPCDCLTNVGAREGPNGASEQTFWDPPPDPRDTTIANLRKALVNVADAINLIGTSLMDLSVDDPQGLVTVAVNTADAARREIEDALAKLES